MVERALCRVPDSSNAKRSSRMKPQDKSSGKSAQISKTTTNEETPSAPSKKTNTVSFCQVGYQAVNSLSYIFYRFIPRDQKCFLIRPFHTPYPGA